MALLKPLFVMGENPMVSDPDINHLEEGLKNLDLLICQDIFLHETGHLADVVFPSAAWGEKDGTYTNSERRVQQIRKAVYSPGKTLPDWEILTMLAKKMGADWNYTDPRVDYGRDPCYNPVLRRYYLRPDRGCGSPLALSNP